MSPEPGLYSMIDNYCEAIKLRLKEQERRGYYGWNESHMQGPIEQKLLKNFRQKDWIDVGALAAMRWDFANNQLNPSAKSTPG